MSSENKNLSWSGSVALVTGASAGIGAAVAKALADDGLTVVVCARRLNRLESLAKEVEGKSKGKIVPYKCDCGDAQAIIDLFDKVEKEVGPVSVLVNNAGLGRPVPQSQSTSKEDLASISAMLNVNVLGLCVAQKEFSGRLRSRKAEKGQIVNIASMAAHRIPGLVGMGLYSATKHAVRVLTESLRREFREDKLPYRVCQISPGLVETEFEEVYFNDKEKAKTLIDSLTMLQSSDIVDAVRFVLSSPPRMEVNDILVRPTAQKA